MQLVDQIVNEYIYISRKRESETKVARIGYARVSSKDQNIDRQLVALEGVSKVFSDKLSGRDTERPQLQAMLEYLREGDVVVVTELDRLSRKNKDLTEIMNQIQQKGATLDILNLPTMNGIEDENLRRLINHLIIELYKYQAESDRERIKERQKQGIDVAKTKGKYKGRKPLFTEENQRLQFAFKEYQKGATDKEVEELTGISRETFRRYRLKYGIQRKKKDKQLEL